MGHEPGNHPPVVVEAGFTTREAVEAVLAVLRPDEASGQAFDGDAEVQESCLSLGECTTALAEGTVAIVQWMSARADVAWIQVHGPRSQPNRRTRWLLACECTDTEWVEIMERLQDDPQCRFAVVSLEEAVELSEPVSPDDVPWDHWRLVQAFVRHTPVGITKRDGPAYRKVRKSDQ